MRNVVSVVVLGLALGCSGAPTTSSSGSSWAVEVAWDADGKLGGCAVGDVDPRHPGSEVCVVAGDGRVACLRRTDDGVWSSEILAELPGEMIQCAIGDVRPDHPGNELVTVGMATGGEDDGGAGAAFVFWCTDDGWQHEQLLEDDALVHGVAIGELDPDHAGHEIVIAGYTNRVQRVDADTRIVTTLGTLSGAGKGVAIEDGAVFVCCADGSVAVVADEGEHDGWTVREMTRHREPMARISASNDDVLVCANDGVLRLLDRSRPGSVVELHRSSDRLRGAVFVDLDPTSAGDEFATAGYDGRVLMVRGRDGIDPGTTVARDDDRLHHLAAGTLPGLGTALVACGYSGRVVVTARR